MHSEIVHPWIRLTYLRSEADRLPHFAIPGLTSVTLHEGLTKIEDWAFHDCLKLKKIRIPKSVTDIGELALGIRYNMGNGAEEVIPGGLQ